MKRMMSLEEIKGEITKFFIDGIVPTNHPRLDVMEDSDRIKVTINERDNNAKCKWITIRLPKNAEILPFRVEEKDYYKIFKHKNRCEVAILVKVNSNSYLILAELKSTLTFKRLKKAKLQITSSLYLLLAILKFIEFVPKGFLAVVGYCEDKLFSEPTDFSLYEMDEERRELRKEWENGAFIVDSTRNSKIEIKIEKGLCHSEINLQLT